MFEFKEGINQDMKKWNTFTCSVGGIYVVKRRNLWNWLYYNSHRMYWVWDAEIDKRDAWQDEGQKFKAHTVILSNKRPIRDLPEFQTKYIQDLIDSAFDSSVLRFLMSTSEWDFWNSTQEREENVSLQAVQFRGSLIKFIENPSIEVQRAAVTQYPHAVHFIDNPSKEIVQLCGLKSKAFRKKFAHFQ